ncbi:MAG: type I restriction enzyme HsdR N-terminal domain-containing protein [Chitinivibrionales bacterium]|nr:type I restriction enzyme HsdR N-terminal domain-containing protein [Chitinivibrionales bacterium]
MDFIDELKLLGEKVAKMKDVIKTEEATKNAFVMPFIQVLGYDIFNPTVVVPEYIADIGQKKGEKVDYAILKDNEPVIIIECKNHNEDLDNHNTQLIRYFQCVNCRIAILTNGVIYRFYSDLEESNKLDKKPFLEFDITNIRDNLVPELKKFHSSVFNLDDILTSANTLKYSKEIRNILSEELNDPTDDFVRYLTSKVYNGRVTEKVFTQFKDIVKKSINQLISDMISDRLKAALEKEKISDKEVEQTEDEPKSIVTTGEELEGFFIVKSILRKLIDVDRVKFKDTTRYFVITLDDNIRKPICRLWLNGTKKKIGIVDDAKNETIFDINTIDDIYNYSDQIFKRISTLEGKKEKSSLETDDVEVDLIKH